MGQLNREERVRLWNKAFFSKCCGGYYSDKPCRANTCNSDHEYCKAHIAIADKKLQKT